MARIVLDSGGSALGIGSSADDGTGDPLRTGGVKLKQWAADLNAMTLELYFGLTPIDVTTATRAVQTTESGQLFTNYGAALVVRADLPAGAANLRYSFERIAAYDLRVDPNGSQAFLGGGAGKYLYLPYSGRVDIEWHVGLAAWRVVGGSAIYSFEA